MGLCFGKNQITPIHTSNEPERIPPLRRMDALRRIPSRPRSMTIYNEDELLNSVRRIDALRRIPSRPRSMTIYNEDELLNSVIVNDHFTIKK